jgi:hypothetical protein
VIAYDPAARADFLPTWPEVRKGAAWPVRSRVGLFAERIDRPYVENPPDFVDALLLAQSYATSLGGVVERIAAWLRGLGIDEQALA